MHNDTVTEVGQVLQDVLRLQHRKDLLQARTPLIGAIPEFDSMAVVSVITALEERFGVAFTDDEIRGESFETVGTLAQLVECKL